MASGKIGLRTDFWQRVIVKIEHQIFGIPVESCTVSSVERNFWTDFGQTDL